MVTIKDMKMPKNCAECKLLYFYLDLDGVAHCICKCRNMEMCGDLNNKRNDFCPLIEEKQDQSRDEKMIDLGDEVVNDYGGKGVVVGICTYEGEVMLSLLMKNYKVPQLVEASGYKTKAGRHFPQIVEVLEQIKGERRK